MIDVFLIRRNLDTDTDGGRPCEDEGRDWRYEVLGLLLETGKVKKRNTSRYCGGSVALPNS